MPEERGLYPKMKVGEQLVYLARLHGLSPRRPRPRWSAGPSGSASRSASATRSQNCSLGNQQRVQLAAALVHDPDVLVLDEPFSGLDPIAVEVMSDVLREKADAGVPVIFSSHQLELVERLCDRVGIIRPGRWWPSAGSTSCAQGRAMGWWMGSRSPRFRRPAWPSTDADAVGGRGAQTGLRRRRPTGPPAGPRRPVRWTEFSLRGPP